MQMNRWDSFPPFDFEQWSQEVSQPIPNNSDGWEQPVYVAVSDSFVMPERSIAPREEGNSWQLQQTVVSSDELMPALMHGVSGLRLDSSAIGFQMNWLEGIHLDMVDLHIAPEILDARDGSIQVLLEAGWQGSCLYEVGVAASREQYLAHLERFANAPNLRIWTIGGDDFRDTGRNRVDAMVNFCQAMDDWLSWVNSSDADAFVELSRFVWRWWSSADALEEVAALRALRALWSRWLDHHDLPFVPIWIDAFTSTTTFRNELATDHLIDLTAATYASVLGGADGVETLTYSGRVLDSARSPTSLRWARNIQHLMREEAGLHRTFDPMGGSRVVDTWSANILEEVWSHYLKSKP